MALRCADRGPFPCFEGYCHISGYVSCEMLSSSFCAATFEDLWTELPHPSLAGRTVAEVCPYACNLCDERCSSPLDLETEPSSTADFLAAYRDKPVNHTCVAHLWIDAVRPTLGTPQTAMLARTTLATALMSVLENTRLNLVSCAQSRRSCVPSRPYLQIWALEPLRESPAQSCPEGAAPLGHLPFAVPHWPIETKPSARELAEATLQPANYLQARRALKTAGVAVVVGALPRPLALELREFLLHIAPRMKHAPVLEANHREHLLLEPDLPLVARALTAVGVRADERGERRGLLADLVPEGATITELASIIVRAGAKEQAEHFDTEARFGDSTMTTAFIVLQDTAAELGALRVSPGTHATQSYESAEDCQERWPRSSQVIEAKLGSATLMDSRLLHHGGAHTLWQHVLAKAGGTGGGEGDGNDEGSDRVGGCDATARVVFYFSWAPPKRPSAPFLPMGSTYALRGELWGRLTVPLRPMGPLFHAMHVPITSEGNSAKEPAESGSSLLPTMWTILDLVTQRIEVCTRGREWHARVALECLTSYGVANAAILFVRHRRLEQATLGIGRSDWCPL